MIRSVSGKRKRRKREKKGKKKKKRIFFFFKQKTAYEIKECDWSSDVCSSDLLVLSEEFDLLSEEFDILLLDTGAGISSNVMYFCTAAQDIIVIALPEPTSITDAYALMKVLSQKHARKDFRLLVNAVKNEGEGKEVFRQLSVVADRFLPNISIDYFGHILKDENVTMTIRQQRAVLEVYPHSKASQCFMAIAKKICDLPYAHPGGGSQFLWRAIIGDEMSKVKG